MTPYICAVFVIFSLLHVEVAPDPFANMENVKLITNTIIKGYDNLNTSNYNTSKPDEILKDVAIKLNNLLKNLSEMGVELRENEHGIRINIPEEIQIETQIHDELMYILKNIIDIDFLFSSYYLQYLDNQTISDASLRSYIMNTINLGVINVERSAFNIHKIMCPGELGVIKDSLMNRIVDILNMNVSHRCRLHESSQQFVYEFFHFIATVELRSFLMTTTAHKIWSITRYAPREKEYNEYLKAFDRLTKGHLERMRIYLSELQRAISKTSTEVVRCEPKLLESYKMKNLKAINKRLKESDYQNNMVVTGLRFVAQNKILHIQIEEGKLAAGGEIVPGSEKWIPLDDMDYDSLTFNQHGQMTGMRQFVEYHTFSLSDYIHLTSVKASDLGPVPDVIPTSDTNYVPQYNSTMGFVVVGVNFEVFELHPERSSDNKKIIYLRLKYAEANYTTGEINSDNVKFSKVLSKITPELKRFDTSSSHDAEGGEYIKLDIQQDSYYNGREFNRMLSDFDSQALYVVPRLPLTGITIYTNNGTNNKHSVSLGIFALDISFRINAD